MSQTEQPKKHRGGPPRGNQNALRFGLTVADVPRQFRFIQRKLLHFRKELEAQLAKKRPQGELSMVDAAYVHSAVKILGLILKIERAIRKDPDMSLERQVTLEEKRARAAEKLAKITERLLDGPDSEPRWPDWLDEEEDASDEARG